MLCLGTIVNVAAILIGGCAGLILKKALSKRITDTVMQGVGLAVIIIGVSGALGAAFIVDAEGKVSSNHILFMIIALAAGGLIGELLRIEDRLDVFAKFCERKFEKIGARGGGGGIANGDAAESSAPSFAQGFTTAALVFCVGSMAIVGSFEDGINRNSDILFAKSALDGISSMIFASTMGVGVLFSAIAVGLYQGSLTLLAIFVAPYFNDVVVTQISLIGSVLILGIGLNMLQIAKIKVGNLLPAIFAPIAYNIINEIIHIFTNQ